MMSRRQVLNIQTARDSSFAKLRKCRAVKVFIGRFKTVDVSIFARATNYKAEKIVALECGAAERRPIRFVDARGRPSKFYFSYRGLENLSRSEFKQFQCRFSARLKFGSDQFWY
jgi:hypothetical protein